MPPAPVPVLWMTTVLGRTDFTDVKVHEPFGAIRLMILKFPSPSMTGGGVLCAPVFASLLASTSLVSGLSFEGSLFAAVSGRVLASVLDNGFAGDWQGCAGIFKRSSA